MLSPTVQKPLTADITGPRRPSSTSLSPFVSIHGPHSPNTPLSPSSRRGDIYYGIAPNNNDVDEPAHARAVDLRTDIASYGRYACCVAVSSTRDCGNILNSRCVMTSLSIMTVLLMLSDSLSAVLANHELTTLHTPPYERVASKLRPGRPHCSRLRRTSAIPPPLTTITTRLTPRMI